MLGHLHRSATQPAPEGSDLVAEAPGAIGAEAAGDESWSVQGSKVADESFQARLGDADRRLLIVEPGERALPLFLECRDMILDLERKDDHLHSEGFLALHPFEIAIRADRPVADLAGTARVWRLSA